MKDKDGSAQTSDRQDEDVQKKESGSTVTGRWKPVEMNLKGMSEEEKAELMKGLALEFTADGKFYAHNNENRQEGTYTFDPLTLKMTVVNTTRGNDTEHFSISWEKGLLLMTNEEGTVKLERQ